jgi:hypothetical protein
MDKNLNLIDPKNMPIFFADPNTNLQSGKTASLLKRTPLYKKLKNASSNSE